MKQSILSAVLAVEHRLQLLIDERTNPNQTPETRAKVEADIQQAKRELMHFRAALKFERQQLEESDLPED